MLKAMRPMTMISSNYSQRLYDVCVRYRAMCDVCHTEECGDELDESLCTNYKRAGYCAESHEYGWYVREKCAKTCG